MRCPHCGETSNGDRIVEESRDCLLEAIEVYLRMLDSYGPKDNAGLTDLALRRLRMIYEENK